jgi:hypothetical protein
VNSACTRTMAGLSAAVLTAIAMLGSSSCAVNGDSGPGLTRHGEAETPRPLQTVSASKASTLLAALPRRARPDRFAGYSRDAFGPAWKDIDDNGCNQRDDVLLRDAVPGSTQVQQQGACAHDVLAGTWVDPYSGARLVFTDLKDLSQAQAIQIDHVVPLAEAWVSGASSWSPGRRLRYANALADLVAASGPVNASKGANDPAAWRPKKAYQCSYASRWILVKHRWRLAVDGSEVRALAEMLQTCAPPASAE